MKFLLVKTEYQGKEWDRLFFQCPGCDDLHAVSIRSNTRPPPEGNPSWEWDGNINSPTVSPSILVTYGRGSESPEICHSFLRGGKLEMLSDCTHSKAGQTSETLELPDWFIKERRL